MRHYCAPLLPEAASAMTTPGGVFIRRSEFDDQPGIQALIGQEAEQVAKRFRHVDVTNMIENASLGITAVDEKGAVVGYAAFYDFPALTSEVDPVAWPEWLHGAFGHPEFTEANTAFLSFFLADPLCESEVLENILRTAFTTLPDVDALLFLLPRDVKLFAPLRDTFDALQPLAASEEEEAAVRAYACPRGLYLPDLLIREARVEDHDDLVPVFNAQSEVLTERYGEFFIAELIEAQEYQKAFTHLTKRLKPLEASAASLADFKDLCYLLTCRSVHEVLPTWQGAAAARDLRSQCTPNATAATVAPKLALAAAVSLIFVAAAP